MSSEKPVVQVVAAIIRKGDRLLICQRPKDKAQASRWEFPGGKIEPGETGPVALIRECKEELAVTLTVGERYSIAETQLPDKTMQINFYWAELGDQVPKQLEHQAFRWVKKEELKDFSFCPADMVVAQKLLRENTL